MGRRLGGGVPEGEHAVPALHHLGRDLSGRNRTEHARPHTPRLPLPARAVLASERLAQLLPQLLAARALRWRLALDLRQRLQGRPLLGRELRRRPHVHAHVQIALPPLTDARQPLGAQPIDRAGLRARLHLERRGAVGGRYVQLRAERGLRKGERQVVNQVVAMALEARVVGDVEHRDQIAGWAVARTRHARAAHREIVMVGDAGGDVDLDTLLGAHATVALALGTRVLEHRAVARAAGARGQRNELAEHRPRGTPPFARAAARATRGGARARRRARAGARGAAVERAQLHGLGGAARHLGEIELQRDLQVLPAVPLAPGALTATEQGVEAAEPPEVAHEHVERFGEIELRESEVAPAAPAAPEPGRTVAVVHGALLGIAQDFVGFGDLLELRLGLHLLLDANLIGVIAHRQLAVGLLDLGLVRRARDPENGVVVEGHSSSSPTRRLV